ncbi:hypothetical protein Tco_1122870 [Tanacetum coccineum]|uniref:Uncharacterized protein n=1 Tax=Tanacetum coccineum TaxID=301880 RepID=A0ABQ5J3G9_9ASTR
MHNNIMAAGLRDRPPMLATEEQEMQQIQDKAKMSCMIFTDTMFLNVDQLERQLDKEEFQEIGSMVAFRALETQFQKFIKPRILLNDEDGIMTRKTESKEQDTSSRSGNDAHADDAYIRPIYNEEPMAEVQTTDEINVFAIGQQHAEQPDFNNEGKVEQNVEQCHNIRLLPAKLMSNQILGVQIYINLSEI